MAVKETSKRYLRIGKSIAKGSLQRYKTLSLAGKCLIWVLVAMYIAIGTAFIVITPAVIFQWLYDLAHHISEMKNGWLILAAIVILMCFPPFPLNNTSITLCGFAYGMKGFLLAAVASSVGSALSFIIFRYFFAKRFQRWSAGNKKWTALETVIQKKGLPLIILIRMSNFPPWVWANIVFSSIDSVALWQFIVATLFVYPKICLHVFIGTRAAALSDGETRSHMDTQTKVVNGVLIGAGIVLAATSGWVVYRFTQKQIRELEDLPQETDRLAADGLEDIEEGAPLLRSFSPDKTNGERHSRSLSP